MTATRLHLLIAALFGAAGTLLLAAGAHAAGTTVTTAGQMLLFHAPTLMAATLARKAGFLHGPLAQVGLALLALGVALFSADLALRGFHGTRLFAMAAPTGGSLTIVGWLMLALAAALPAPR